jgi:hypothetical protein
VIDIEGRTPVNFGNKRPGRGMALRLSIVGLGVAMASGASATAFAFHRETTASAPLRGLITAVGNTGMQLQTTNGTVSVGLVKGTTHVVRYVMGSTADVTPGKRVDLHLVKGTRMVDAIYVEQNNPAPARRTVVRTTPRSGDRSLPHRDANDTASQFLSGQVVSLSGGTITVRYGNGSAGTFPLGSNVIVNEALSGSLADLGVGETVQVFLGKSGSVAKTIIIINA